MYVRNLWVYPLKGFDRMAVDEVRLTGAGTFAGDREYALVPPDATVDGEYDTVGGTFNGKDIEETHAVETTFDPGTATLTVAPDEGEPRRFALAEADGRGAASAWFSDRLDRAVALRRREPPGFVDRDGLGPSVVSTATLETVADWFEEMTVAGARRRLRPNVEVDGVPAFWEDRFLGTDPDGFELGGTSLSGAQACVRCVVPSRDPETGERIPGFAARFAKRREASLPGWLSVDDLPSPFSVMLITRVPDDSRGETVAVGDAVSVPD